MKPDFCYCSDYNPKCQYCIDNEEEARNSELDQFNKYERR